MIEVEIEQKKLKFENRKKLEEYLNSNELTADSSGNIYKIEGKGIVPSILELWFNQRVEFQNLAKKFAKEGDKEKESYYNRRQHCQKIFLNSVYGILGLSSSRLYSKDNAESTTISGQTIIKTSEKIVIEHFKQLYAKYGKTLEDTTNVVQYIDTDSLYISVDEVANMEGIKEEDKKEYTKKFCLEVVEKLNNFYPILSKRLFNSDDNKIKIAADTINQTALWKKKKAYALNQSYDMGKGKDVNKIKVVGLSSVRSDFPLKFKSFLEKFLKDILYRAGETKISQDVLEIKNNINNYSVLDLAKNTSVKFFSEKKNENFNPKNRKPFTIGKGATAQCKAALMYNDLLVHFKLNKKVEPIYHGQKIKYVYLKDNEFGIDALAMKGDGTDPKDILDIIEMYCDKKKMYTSVLENKIEDFYQILGWKMPSSESDKASEFFSF